MALNMHWCSNSDGTSNGCVCRRGVDHTEYEHDLPLGSFVPYVARPSAGTGRDDTVVGGLDSNERFTIAGPSPERVQLAARLLADSLNEYAAEGDG